MKRFAFSLLCISALGACSVIPPEAYSNRGDPERLLTATSEVINISLASRGALGEISKMVSQDPPSRAQLNCRVTEALCAEARSILVSHAISYETTGQGDGVSLFYENVTARDCENRYIDNSINPYNLPPKTFGCSVAGNTVQMVSDKRQFSNPNLLDFTDGQKADQNYDRYQKPPEPQQDSTSLLRNITVR